MWKIEWDKECEICKCPLNITIKVEDDVDKVIKMILCTTVHGLNLTNNKKYVHVNGNGNGKEFMCKYCYNKGWMGHKDIMTREIKVIKTKRNKGWRERELREWSEKVWRIMSDNTVNWKEFIEAKDRVNIEGVEIYCGEYLVQFNLL